MVRRQLARWGLAALLALAMAAAPAAAAPPQSPAPEADGTLWESGDELASSFSLSPAGLELEVGSSAALALRASPAALRVVGEARTAELARELCDFCARKAEEAARPGPEK